MAQIVMTCSRSSAGITLTAVNRSTVRVVCEAIRGTDPQKKVLVTEAQVVYVNVGEDRKPKPIEPIANA